MHPRIDEARSATPETPREAAQRAASSEALAQRIAELERTLAAERASHATRAREVEGVVAILRKSLHQLQDEAKVRREENLRLVEQLDQSRRMVETMSATAPEPDAAADDGLETALHDAEDAVDAARAESELLRARVASLEDELIVRENELTRASDRISELEAIVAAASRVPAAAVRRAPAAVESRDALDDSASISVESECPEPVRPEPARPAASPVVVAPTPAPKPAVAAAPAPAPAKPVVDRPAAPLPEAQSEFLADETPLSTHSATLTDSVDARPAVPAAPTASGPTFSTGVAAHAAAAVRNDEQHALCASHQDPQFPQIPGIRLERLVDETPAGIVYEAREVATRRPVVVRVLPGVLKLLDGKRLDSVLLAKHPNLVSVLGFAVCRQGPYLVMERDEGETADQWVARLGTLPERIALSVILEIARGLRQAAFHGAFHGDLGPDAVLIDVAGRVRVRGVGLRPVLFPNDTAPRSPEFASPERLRGSPPPDVRADIYSLGAVLHFLLAGKAPYTGERDAILRQQAANAMPDIREVRTDVSDETAKLLRRLLASDPDMRPQTWDQLLVELERRVPGRVSTALRGNLSTRTRRFVVANPWVLGAAIGGLLLVAGIWRVALSHDPSAADRYRESCAIAEKLAAAGNVEEARTVYRRFLAGTGDPDVERDAAKRFDELKK